MFYLFHHLPKCGGTSFNAFLSSIFKVYSDYSGVNRNIAPEKFELFRRQPLDLVSLDDGSCLAGHYNIDGIFLSQRYPDLETVAHKKFSIIREPFEAAQSGVRFNIMRGWASQDMTKKQKTELLFKRVNYFAKIFEIKDESQIDELFDKYWFIAPIEHIADAAKLIETDVGRVGAAVDVLNTTPPDDGGYGVSVWDSFRERSNLDYLIYEAAKKYFKP